MTMAETYSGKFSTSSETQGQSIGLGEKAGRSFQLRAKEPLGTYSILTELFPKIQADAVSWLGTKYALYYCAKSTNSFFWVLFVSSYMTAICPVLSPSLCLQGKLLFSTFLTTNERTTGSFARTWKLSSRLFTRPDLLPLGLRGCVNLSLAKNNRNWQAT